MQATPATGGASAAAIFALLRRERVLGSLFWSLPMALVVGALLTLLDVAPPEGRATVREQFPVAVLFLRLTPLVLVLMRLPTSRVLPHELPWPILPRDLLLVRFLALAISLVAPVLVVLGPTVAVVGVLGQGAWELATAAVGLVLVAAIGCAWRPGHGGLSFPERLGLLVVGVLLVAGVGLVGGAWLLVPYAVASAMLLSWSYEEAPLAWELDVRRPRAPEGERGGAQWPAWNGGAASRELLAARSGSRGTLALAILRTLLSSRRQALLVASIVLWFVLTGRSTSDVLRASWTWIGLLVLLVVSVWRRALAACADLDALPLGRRRLAPLLLLPPLVAFLGTTWMSWEPMRWRLVAGGPDFLSEVGVGRNYEGWRVRVPASAWSVGRADAPAVAPWGEVGPRPARFSFLSLTVSDPFAVGEENSVRFLAWQASRAKAAVDGEEVSVEEVLALWMPTQDPATRLSDLPRPGPPVGTSVSLEVSPATHRPLLEVLASLSPGFPLVLAVGAWLLLGLYVLRCDVPARGRRALLGRAAATLLPLLTLGVLGSWVILAERTTVLQVLVLAAWRGLDGLLGGSPFAWLALALVLALSGYRLLLGRFLRLELGGGR